MNENQQCPKCGQPVPPDAPEGLCPRCLGALNLDSETGVAGTGTTTATPPSAAELAPHFPQLEILEVLGRGGMGVVYKVRQKELDRFAALKILPPGIGGDPAFAERFAREAKALARLNHPGIVTIYDSGRTDGLYYFLMEFVDGVSLGRLMRGGRVSAREALAIVPQICDALQYAHDQGIVHRDIKPENILLDRQGRVKVADFGLAKLVTGTQQPLAASLSPSDGGSVAGGPGEGRTPALTDAGKIMGTPAYMAPEQAAHPGEVDHRADIYALGVVFYQMLTGELPGQRLDPPSRKVHIDVRLDEVVLRALEHEPERRYQQVSQVKTAVETIAGTPDPSTGRGEKAQTEVAKPRQDWGTWSPLQSQEVGAICSHLTKAERNHFSVLGLLASVWIVGTCFGISAFIRSQSGSGKWIVVSVWVTLFAVSIPMLQRMVRHFLCSTTWARERGFAPERLRLFAFSRGNLWKVCAVLAVGLGLVFALDEATRSYLGLGRSPQSNQSRKRSPTQATAAAHNPSFGPVIETWISGPGTGLPFVFSFETGRYYEPPKDIGEALTTDVSSLDAAALQWLRENHGNAILAPDDTLRFFDGLVYYPTINGHQASWEELTPDRVIRLVDGVEDEEESKDAVKFITSFRATLRPPAAMVFTTREGCLGVLQILGSRDIPRRMDFRYKLVRGSKANTALKPIPPKALELAAQP